MPGPDNNITAIVQGLGRCSLKSNCKDKQAGSRGYTENVSEILPNSKDKEFKTAIDDLRNTTAEYINKMMIFDESHFALSNIQNDIIAVDFICFQPAIQHHDKIKMLKADSIMERVLVTLKVLHKEIQLMQLKQNIRTKTRRDIDDSRGNISFSNKLEH